MMVTKRLGSFNPLILNGQVDRGASGRTTLLVRCINYASGVIHQHLRPVLFIASKTIHGSNAISANSTRAGPVGFRRRCSQLRSVRTGKPMA